MRRSYLRRTISGLSSPLCLAALIVLLACTPAPVATSQKELKQSDQPKATVNDAELLEQIRVFASDVGDKEETAWKQLNSYPRPELVSSLLRIRDSLPADDYQRVLIAFVLCHLNYQYQENRQIVASSLPDKSKYAHLGGDWAADLVGRLVRRGDEELLPTLFEAAGRSDGAMAESLSDLLLEEMSTKPETFLLRLRAEPRRVRADVYGLLFNEATINDDDARKFSEYLKSIPRSSPIGEVAHEMLGALTQYELGHKLPPPNKPFERTDR